MICLQFLHQSGKQRVMGSVAHSMLASSLGGKRHHRRSREAFDHQPLHCSAQTEHTLGFTEIPPHSDIAAAHLQVSAPPAA
jgi:hypothetical protein